jgi:hypothetical protein
MARLPEVDKKKVLPRLGKALLRRLGVLGGAALALGVIQLPTTASAATPSLENPPKLAASAHKPGALVLQLAGGSQALNADHSSHSSHASHASHASHHSSAV